MDRRKFMNDFTGLILSVYGFEKMALKKAGRHAVWHDETTLDKGRPSFVLELILLIGLNMVKDSA